MKIKTKFDVGQVVHLVSRKTTRKLKVCPVCSGDGWIDIKILGKLRCPNACDDNGKVVDNINHKWVVSDLTKIRDVVVSLKVVSDNRVQIEVKYNGIHSQHRVFASENAAQAWCDITNKMPTTNEAFHGEVEYYEQT